MADMVKIFPDKEKAKSILKMVDTTLVMIKTIDTEKFPSNVLKEYYDVLRELMSILLLLDGYKIVGEEAHKELIEYIGKKYKQLSDAQIILMDDLRIKRNKIAYDGFFIDYSYLKRKQKDILIVLDILKELVAKRIN